MKELGNSGKETRLHKAINEYKQPFMDVRTELGLDEKVGFGVCPAAHQGRGEYPLLVLPLSNKEDGSLQTFTTLHYFPEMYDFKSLMDYHKKRGWSNFQGHEIVSPSKPKDKDDFSYFVSFWMHPLGFENPTETKHKITPLHPLLKTMPKDVFKGGVALSIAKTIYGNYPEFLADKLLTDLSVKYLKYMRSMVLDQLKKAGTLEISDEDISNAELSEDLNKKLKEQFPSLGMKVFGYSWEEPLLMRARNYSNELHKLAQAAPRRL